ncbi:MAG: fibronectin type III domain-containing protein [Planctomycetota bacterium]
MRGGPTSDPKMGNPGWDNGGGDPVARRSGYAFVVVAALIVPAAPVRAAADRGASGASGPKQWRITWTENPHTRAVVSWNTDSPGRTHRVHYDTRRRSGRRGAYRHQQPCARNGAYSGSLHYHHAELTGLTPGTTYYFVMASGDAVSREFHFTTAPAEDVPFKIIFGWLITS